MRALSLFAALCAFGVASAASAEIVTYTYDARGRVVSVTHVGGVNNGVVTTYSHDAADNRARVTTTGASH